MLFPFTLNTLPFWTLGPNWVFHPLSLPVNDRCFHCSEGQSRKVYRLKFKTSMSRLLLHLRMSQVIAKDGSIILYSLFINLPGIHSSECKSSMSRCKYYIKTVKYLQRRSLVRGDTIWCLSTRICWVGWWLISHKPLMLKSKYKVKQHLPP